MAIVLASVAYWAPVSFILIGDDAQPHEVKFRARFKRIKRSEREEIERLLKERELDDKAFLDRLLVDWDLEDVRGEKVPYTEATRAELVEDWDGLEIALVQSFFEAGRKVRDAGEQAKNSAAPSAPTT